MRLTQTLLLIFLFHSVVHAHTLGTGPEQERLVANLLAQFDRELEATPREKWSLETSPAYQNLLAVFAGDDHPMSRPRKFEPGTGSKGQLNGSEFPANTWALTYDDGPHGVVTFEIYKVLNDNKVKATFFWLAENVVKHGPLVQQAEALGHPVQNHSYTHADLKKATDLALGFEVAMSKAVMADHYQTAPEFFRCPYGSGSSVARVRKAIADADMVSVMWNVDSLDWADKDPASVAARVHKQMAKQGRGIILFHDIQKGTPEASAKLFALLNKAGSRTRFVTIPQIVAELNSK